MVFPKGYPTEPRWGTQHVLVLHLSWGRCTQRPGWFVWGARSWPPPNSLQPLLSPKPWRISPVSLLPSRFGRLEPAPAPVAAAATAGGCGARAKEAPAARTGTRRSQRRRGRSSKRGAAGSWRPDSRGPVENWLGGREGRAAGRSQPAAAPRA